MPQTNTVTSFHRHRGPDETGRGAAHRRAGAVGARSIRVVLSDQTVTLDMAGTLVTITATDHDSSGRTGTSGTFTVNPSGIHHYVVSASERKAARAVSPRTVLARTANNNTVTTDNSTVVTMTSSGSAQVDSDGNGTFGDNTKTLVNGTFTISTRDSVWRASRSSATPPAARRATSSSITINPAAGDYQSHETRLECPLHLGPMNGSVWGTPSADDAPSQQQAALSRFSTLTP